MIMYKTEPAGGVKEAVVIVCGSDEAPVIEAGVEASMASAAKARQLKTAGKIKNREIKFNLIIKRLLRLARNDTILYYFQTMASAVYVVRI